MLRHQKHNDIDTPSNKTSKHKKRTTTDDREESWENATVVSSHDRLNTVCCQWTDGSVAKKKEFSGGFRK